MAKAKKEDYSFTSLVDQLNEKWGDTYKDWDFCEPETNSNSEELVLPKVTKEFG